MRIFQLAKELNVDSQEIIDALEDMDIQVKSNLTALDDDLIGELRELFKPRPKPTRSAKDDAVARAIAERNARERAAEEARRREEERKEQARQEALRRAAKKRESLARSKRDAEEAKRAEIEAAQRAQAEAEAREQAEQAAPIEEEPLVEEQPVGEAAAAAESAAATEAEDASAEEPAAREEAAAAEEESPTSEPSAKEPAAAKKDEGSAAAKPSDAESRSSLGKAVIAPPPQTAKERAEMLGTRLSDPRVSGRQAAPPPARPAPPPGPGPRGGVGQRRPGGGPGSAGGAFGDMTGGRKKKKKRKGDKKQERRPLAEARPEPVLEPVGEIKISDGITVKDIAERMDRKAKDVIAKLFLDKKMIVTINHALDEDTAAWVVEAFGGNPDLVAVEDEAMEVAGEAPEGMVPEESTGIGELRAPVVTMMGHVDHGKTSLLDAIKETRVAEREAGGITQHIGAYKVGKEYEGKDREIVFLDTPGHAAFTLMRARGATVTDIIVLVVAADDGVMPQTIEAINHARSANVPIIVAVNKVDKDGALPERVLQQLTEHEILVEEYGGETVACKVSAKTHEGIDHLLEMILLTADLQEFRAHPERPASGTVLEAQLDKSRGAVATVLVQNGTLHVGDVFVVGSTLGRVRALIDERDRRLQEAGPSTPVQIMGLEDVPEAGDGLQVFPNEQKARQIALYRQGKLREEKAAASRKLPTLELLAQQISEGDMTELPVIVKGDVQGSVEVLRKALTDLSTDEVQVKVIHGATGAITETDVLLAQAGKAIVVGFNVRPQRGVKELAEREGVDIRLHTVIYKVTDEIKAAMLAQLSPVEREVYLGRAEVLETFKVPKVGIIAGSKVTDGVIRRDAQVRLLRDNIVIHEGKVGSLRRFKDDAKEVRSGFECGIGIERYNDLKPGDEIEAFVIELKQRESLEAATESKDS